MFIFIVLFNLLFISNGERVHDLLRNGNRRNPGVAIRITEKGVEYVKELGLWALKTEIPKIRIPDMARKIDDQTGKGTVTISDVRITRYRHPRLANRQVHLIPPNRAQLRLRGLSTSAKGKFSANYQLNGLPLPIRAKGEFTIDIGNLNYIQTIIMSASPNGQPHVEAGPCSVRTSDMDIQIRNSGFLMDLVLNIFQGIIIERVKPMVESEICTVITRMIDKDANSMLDTFPLSIQLGNTGLGKITSIMGFSRRKKRATKDGLVLDYRLMSDPKIQRKHVTIFLVGEVSWKGRGGTPFYPEPMGGFPERSSKMLYLHGSDYIINSLLYHSYRRGLLTFLINADTKPAMRDRLKTTCDPGAFNFCIGDMLPDLDLEYPDHLTEMYIEPSETPILIFREDKAYIEFHGDMKMSAYPESGSRNRRVDIFTADIVLKAEAKLRLVGQRVAGEMSIESLTARLKTSQLPSVDQDILDELVDLSSGMVSEDASKVMKTGMPLPSVDGLRLREPTKFYLKDRFCRIKTFFQLSKRQIQDMMFSAVRNFGS